MSLVGRGREPAGGRISAEGGEGQSMAIYQYKCETARKQLREGKSRKGGNEEREPEGGRRSSRIAEVAEGGVGRGSSTSLAFSGKDHLSN